MDVIISVMRRHKTWIKMVAMLALVMGFIPTSVVASLFATNCNMACCVGKPAHEMADPVCLKGCDSTKAPASKTVALVQEKQADNCKCSIGSSPSTPQPDVAAAPPSGSTLQQVVADLPPAVSLVPAFTEPESKPGIFGTDSGPPASGPNYVSLGRAPPVLLA